MEDEERRFDRPVRVVESPRGNVARTVTTTAEAARFLLDKWPGDPGSRKHLAARKACIAVLEGIKEARVARKAFEAAAEDANILLPPLRPVKLEIEGPKLWNKRTRKLKRDQ